MADEPKRKTEGRYRKWLYLFQGVFATVVSALLISMGASPRSIAVAMVAAAVGFGLFYARNRAP